MSPTKLTRISPSSLPSVAPSSSPTISDLPSISPTRSMSPSGSKRPSSSPTMNPSTTPTISSKPSMFPTSSPTVSPSSSTYPSISLAPTIDPTQIPTSKPTVIPSSMPTFTPTSTPTNIPTETNADDFTLVLNMFIDSFSSALDDNEKDAFEQILKEFLQERQLLTEEFYQVNVNITSVKMISQIRTSAAENGLVTSDRKRSLDVDGLMIQTLVTGTMTYGKYPDSFVVDDVIASALNNDFNVFVSRLESDQSFSLAIGGDEEEEKIDNKNDKKRKSFIIWISVGCGAGGMIMGALLLLAQSRRKKLQEFRLATDRRLNYPGHSSGFDQSFTSSYIEEDKEERWVPEWDPNKIYEAKSAQSYLYRKTSFEDNPDSEYNSSTPVSTSSVSLGINLSPQARNEAMKHHQHFFFEPHSASQDMDSADSKTKDFSAPHTTFTTYAAPGPVGIVIETSKEGPTVHSVRNTSQLLGTVMPGDIIIGLDNIETRGLVAPALTRLMARKSQQEQRKITFLRPM